MALSYAVRIQWRKAASLSSGQFQVNKATLSAGTRAASATTASVGKEREVNPGPAVRERRTTRSLLSGKYGSYSKPSTESYRQRRRGKLEKPERILPVSGSSAAYESATSRHRRMVEFDRSRGKAQQQRKFVNPSEFRLPITTDMFQANREDSSFSSNRPIYDTPSSKETLQDPQNITSENDNNLLTEEERETERPQKRGSILFLTIATLVTTGAAVASQPFWSDYIAK